MTNTNTTTLEIGTELRAAIDGEVCRIRILSLDVDGDPEFVYLDGPSAGDIGVCMREDLIAAIAR